MQLKKLAAFLASLGVVSAAMQEAMDGPDAADADAAHTLVSRGDGHPKHKDPWEKFGYPCGRFNGPKFCQGTYYNTSLLNKYVCGDWRLGQTFFPNKDPYDPIFALYDRFARRCPSQFIADFWNAGVNPPTWKSLSNPPATFGCSVKEMGPPDLLDHFGPDTDIYLNPYGTPYGFRGLPPSAANTPLGNPTTPYNYHVYQVQKSALFRVCIVTPNFGQQGFGTFVQYPITSTSKSIKQLIQDGVLNKIDPHSLAH